jgi:hypothetical protein
MEIELPNGTVIEAPEGMPYAKAVEYAKAYMAKKQDKPSTGETIARSFGSGATFGLGTPITALGSAAGSYLGVPSDVEKAGREGSFGDRYSKAKEYLTKRAQQGAEQDPVASTVSGLAGGLASGAGIYRALPKAIAPFTSMVGPGVAGGGALRGTGNLLSKSLAGTADAALMNATVGGLSNAEKGPEAALQGAGEGASSPWNYLGAAAPVLNAALPAARASAQNWRDRAAAKVPSVFRMTNKGKELMLDKLGQGSPDVDLGLRTAGNKVLSLQTPEGQPVVRTGQNTSQMGSDVNRIREQAGKTLDDIRTQAEPTATVDFDSVLKEMDATRDQMFPARATSATGPMAQARAQVDEAINRFILKYGASGQVPLSDWTNIKTAWQKIANETSSGGSRTADEISGKALLSFYDKAGGVLKQAEESAVEAALPHRASEFRTAKEIYGTTSGIQPIAKESALAGKHVPGVDELQYTFSPRGALWHTAINWAIPSPQRRIGWDQRASRMAAAIPDMSPATPALGIEAVMAELLRQKENR